MVKPSIKSRFYQKVALPAGPDACWPWIGAMSDNGYGNFWTGEKQDKAHRVSYQLFVGAIPDGADLDHLCRNRGCVRPDHLEPVDRQTNLLRGDRKSKQANCKRGHPLSGDNVRIYLTPGKGYVTRICRACDRRPYLGVSD